MSDIEEIRNMPPYAALVQRIAELETALSNSVNADWHNERIAELEADRDHQLKARKDLEQVIRDRNKKIRELEETIENLEAELAGEGW